MKAFGGDQQFYAQTFVAVAPDGMDPCELRQTQGDEALRQLVENAQPMFRFAIRTVLAGVDLETAEGRAAGLRAAAPIVAGIRDDALRSDYTRQLAGWVAADESLVRRAVREARTQRPARQNASPTGAITSSWARSNDHVVRAEYQAMAAALQYPPLVPAQFDELGADSFQVPALRAVHDAVRAAGGIAAVGEDQANWLARVREEAAAPVAALITALAVEPLPVVASTSDANVAEDQTPVASYVSGVIGGLLEMGLTRRIGELRGKLQRLDAAEDTAERARVLNRVQELENQRRDLREEY
jgi:DNA primase